MTDTVRTQTEILALLADNTSGDISPQDMRDSVVSARRNQGHAWALYSDSEQYLEANSTTFAAGVRRLLTIDELGFAPPNITTEIHDMLKPWDSNQLWAEANCLYTVNIYFSISVISGTGNHHFHVEVDIGGARSGFEDVRYIPKGSGIENEYTITIPMFGSPDFVSNGGAIYITADTDMELWQPLIHIARTYVPDN